MISRASNLLRSSILKSNKVKLLNNYQLYQLMHNRAVDTYTRTRLKQEFDTRTLSSDEKKDIEEVYQSYFSKQNPLENKKQWNPLWTAFALNFHFRQLALLKVHGRKKEAQKYMIALYFGLTLYFTLLLILFWLSQTV